MPIKTLWRALWQTPAGPLLLAAQVAISLMIFANVAYIIHVRLETTGRPTGMDMDNIFWISSQGYGKDFDAQRTVKFDLAYLNALPSVIAATVSNGPPQTLSALRSQVSAIPELKGRKRFAMVYQTTDKVIDALGLRLTTGRIFNSDAVRTPSLGDVKHNPFGQEIVITEALADKIFGGSEQALGKLLYFSISDGASATVVGVVALLQGAPNFGPGTDWDWVYEGVLAPGIPAGSNTTYIVRTVKGARDQVMARVKREFQSFQPNRYVDDLETLSATAARARATDRNSAVILALLASLVLIVTMFGLFGFASFTVTSRTKEIGTRRAIGATRAEVLQQFLVENWLITTLGVIAGFAMTGAFAIQLRALLELPTLPAVYLVGAMALIWISGLLAAMIPALRAARVPPAVATRLA